jgi:hypothetical protein
MSFYDYHKKLQKAIDQAIHECAGYKNEEDVDNLRSTISALKDYLGEIEHYVSDCYDEYDNLNRNNVELTDKIEAILDGANRLKPHILHRIITLNSDTYIKLALINHESGLRFEDHGLQFVDTQVSEKVDYEKEYIFNILDKKLLDYHRIKYEF